MKLGRLQNGVQKGTQIPIDSGLRKLHDYLKAEDLLAVPFDKSCGVCVICVMRKSTYREKLEDALNGDLLQKINGTEDEIVITVKNR